MRIGLDIDGCIYQWDRTARYLLREVLPNSPYKEVLQQEAQSWDWIQEHVSKEHWQWLWTEGVRLGLFRYGFLCTGSVQAIRELAEDHEIVLITHRPKQAVGDTLAWLGLMNLPIAGLHLLTNQEPKSGVRPACDVYLDDKPENVYDLNQNVGGSWVYLMDRPWNQLADWPGAWTVKNWTEFVERVRAIK